MKTIIIYRQKKGIVINIRILYFQNIHHFMANIKKRDINQKSNWCFKEITQKNIQIISRQIGQKFRLTFITFRYCNSLEDKGKWKTLAFLEKCRSFQAAVSDLVVHCERARAPPDIYSLQSTRCSYFNILSLPLTNVKGGTGDERRTTKQIESEKRSLFRQLENRSIANFC